MSWSTGKGPDIVNGGEAEAHTRVAVSSTDVLVVDSERGTVRVVRRENRFPGVWGRELRYLSARFGVAIPRVDEHGDVWDFGDGIAVYVQPGAHPDPADVHRFAREQYPRLAREWVGQQPFVVGPPTQPGDVVLTGGQRIGIMQAQLVDLGRLRAPFRRGDFDEATVRAINATLAPNRWLATMMEVFRTRIGERFPFPFTRAVLQASARWCESAGVCAFPNPSAWAAAVRQQRLRAQTASVLDPAARVTMPSFDRPVLTGAQSAAIVAVDLVDRIYRDAHGLPGAWIDLGA